VLLCFPGTSSTEIQAGREGEKKVAKALEENEGLAEFDKIRKEQLAKADEVGKNH